MVVVIHGTNGIVSPGLTSEDSTGTNILTTNTLVLGGTTVTATGTELNFVDGVTSAIQTQLDAKGTVSSLTNLSITATATEINVLDGIPGTLTATELGYVDGVTSSIQTQLDAATSNISSITLTPQVISTNTAAAAGNFYYLDTAGITLTLPASPSIGDQLGIADVVGDTTHTIAANGNNIMLDSADLTWDIAYKNNVLIYTGATVGWAFSG